MHIGLNAHLLSGRPGFRSAGIHSYIHHLLAELPAAVPANWQLTAMVGAQSTARYDDLDVRRSRLDTESPLRRIIWEQLAQPWMLSRFDLVHALAFVAPVLMTKPSVVTIYDLSFVHYPQRLSATRRLYLSLLTPLSCRRARRVIAISHSTARDLSATFGIPASKIDVAAAGYDATVYHPLPEADIRAFRAARGLPERFWLFVGTLEPRKNLTTLIEAYARLAPSARLPLVIAGGKGWDYEDIFAAVERHQLNGSIQFPGYLAFEEMALWYNSAEVFLYPSVFEGFGLPVLEAMACGTPVIVSDATSLPEVVGDAGMTLPAHNIEAWQAALRRAAGDSEWHINARDRGLTQAMRFSWKETAARTVESYLRVLE